MLAHSTLAEAYLHTVLVEIVPKSGATVTIAASTTLSGSTSALLQIAEQSEPPSAREGTAELYLLSDYWTCIA